MRTKLLTGLIVLLASCGKEPVDSADRLSPLNQVVEFRIKKEREYLEPIYDNTKSSVNLTISVENTLNGDNRVLWDTTLSLRPLRDFPPESTPIVLQKNLRTMLTKDEIIRMSNYIRYEDRDNLVYHYSKGETVPRNLPFISVEIGL
jgi:phospholipid N-methyltransferase